MLRIDATLEPGSLMLSSVITTATRTPMDARTVWLYALAAGWTEASKDGYVVAIDLAKVNLFR